MVRVIKSRRMRWAGHVACMGEERGVYRVLEGKPEGRWPLGRPRRRWADNIKTDLQEVECGYMDWIGLAQDRDRWRTLVSAAMNLRVPWNAGNFLTSCKPVSFSRRTLHHGVIYHYLIFYSFHKICYLWNLSYFLKFLLVSKGCIMQLSISNTALLTILLIIYYYIFTVENYRI